MDNSQDVAKKREEKLLEAKEEAQESEAQRKAQKIGVPYLDLKMVPIDRDNLTLVSLKEAERAGLGIVRKNKKELRVGVVDIENEEAKQIIERLEKQGFKVKIFLISPPSLRKILKEYEKVPLQFKKKEVSGQVDIEKYFKKGGIKNLSDLRKIVKSPNEETSELLDVLLSAALLLDASDIHVEPQESKVEVRLRMDGVLQEVGSISEESYKLLLSRVKLVSGIRINVVDIPQNGRFTVRTPDYEAESRVSILPGAYGEYIVIRLLNPKAVKLEVKDLGIREEIWKDIKEEIEKPNGIVLVTGPTGSGKTTTLYAFLKHLLRPAVKIITLEDPIEYHLEGVSQSQVEPEKDYTFDSGMRSSLRQDPDIILVGEIRDAETAQTALQASLTGHFVFSTLHTNDAPGAIPRFLDLNAKPKILSAALNAVIAQRLVRRLCSECKEPRKLKGEEKEAIKKELSHRKDLIEKIEDEEFNIYKPKGCSKCSETGYKGRVGIFEVLRVTKKIEELINQNPSRQEVLNLAKKEGFLSMYQDGLARVVEGITTIEEVERVAQALD